MERITSQYHNKQTFLYACSRLFERTSYYGLRSLLVLYMISETFKMPKEEAVTIYGVFTIAIIFSQILGGVLGDLFVGNKKAMIIGAIIQAVGAFCFCIPSIFGLYLGLFLVVLGGGFYTPNMLANFGKLYLNKIRLLDSGFAILYIIVKLGALIGVLVIGYYSDTYGWNIGFVIAGFLMIIAAVFSSLVKETTYKASSKNIRSIDERVFKILAAFFMVALFWSIYEISGVKFHFIKMRLSELSAFNLSKKTWSMMSSFFVIPLGLIVVVFWTYFYNNRFIKLAVGFLFGVLSFIILSLVPEIPTEDHLIIYLASLMFLSISEVYVSPIIHSMVIQYTNPKYIAIVISLAFIPIRFLSYLIGLFDKELYVDPFLSLKLAMVIASLVCIGLMTYVLVAKKFVKH